MTKSPSPALGARFGLLRRVYSALWLVILPAVLGRAWLRSRRHGGYPRDWRERLGYVAPNNGPAPIWIHAVSVGETMAAAPLIEALLARGWPVWVTSTTLTGADRVQALFGHRVARSAMPLDRLAVIERFLKRARPRLAIIMETELWPNVITGCQRQWVPIALANARLSARAGRRYHAIRWLIQPMLGTTAFIAAQSAPDAERFQTLGAAPQRVHVAGNLKYDAVVAADTKEHARQLRGRLGEGLIWLAASTHDGEERLLLEAHTVVRCTHPGARLLLAPRHPDRFDRVAALARRAGWRVARLSEATADIDTADILIGDRMGALSTYYAAVDLAVIGGTLSPIGGHNLIEPAAVHCPMIIGPYRHKITDLVAAFEAAFADVPTLAQLPTVVCRLLDHPDERRSLARRAHARLADQRGACARVVALAEHVIKPQSGDDASS